MSGAYEVAFVLLAFLCAGVAGTLVFTLWSLRRARAARRAKAFGAFQDADDPIMFAGRESWVLSYAERLTRRLFTEATEPINPHVRAKRAGKTRAGMAYKRKANAAGCSKDISVSAFCEARTRLTIAGGLAGALFGAVFSTSSRTCGVHRPARAPTAFPCRLLSRPTTPATWDGTL